MERGLINRNYDSLPKDGSVGVVELGREVKPRACRMFVRAFKYCQRPVVSGNREVPILGHFDERYGGRSNPWLPVSSLLGG